MVTKQILPTPEYKNDRDLDYSSVMREWIPGRYNDLRFGGSIIGKKHFTLEESWNLIDYLHY